MKAIIIAVSLMCLTLVITFLYGVKTATPTLKVAFKSDFLIGAAVSAELFERNKQPALDLVKQQFNSASSTNMLKWSKFNPKPNIYNYKMADAYVEFGHKNNMYVLGHVLFWHNQTPEWVYQNQAGQPLTRSDLLARMRERVQHMAKRYGTKINAWDVVNESILDNGELRDSQWTRIVGEDFIEQAFLIASESLPKEVELIYNDYSMTRVNKRNAVVKLIDNLKSKGVRIDGVGMQAHWSIDWPNIADIEESIKAFSAAGVDVHITELDIDVLPRQEGQFDADIGRRLELTSSNNPYSNGLPLYMQKKLTKRYSDIFRIFLKHRDKVKRVTFWGATDKFSWLNNWPIEGRTNYPLLFDREGKPKPAFYAVVNLDRN